MDLNMRNIIILISILFLFGCSQKIDWAMECNNRFPIKETYIKGKDIYHIDTLITPGVIIDCDPIILKAKCPPNKTITNTIYRTDTLKIENTAKIKALEEFIKKNEYLYQQEQNKRLEADKKAEKITKQRNSLAIILICSLGWNFRKLFFRFL